MLYKAFRRRLRKPCLITGMSDEALNAVFGGIGVTAVCDKCVSAAESTGEGACFGAMEQRKNIYLRQSYGHRQLSEMQEVRL